MLKVTTVPLGWAGSMVKFIFSALRLFKKAKRSLVITVAKET